MGDPKCPRCGSSMRILFHVERYCPNDCDRIPPGPSCPKCASTSTAEFTIDYFFGPSEQKLHCWPCGHVWDLQKNVFGTEWGTD